MTTPFRQLMRIGVIATVFIALPGIATFAKDDFLQVPFVFTEDEKLPQTALRASVPHSKALSAEQFLNTPMTRLEYMLTRIESELTSKFPMSYIREMLGEGFEPGDMSVTISTFARYDQQYGRIFAGYEITDLGKAKKPMRSTCDALLTLMTTKLPQKRFGYWYHNTVLGVLAQEDYDEYNKPLDTLAQNVVHVVRLHTATQNHRVVHHLNCQRNEEGGPILYYRIGADLNSRK